MFTWLALTPYTFVQFKREMHRGWWFQTESEMLQNAILSCWLNHIVDANNSDVGEYCMKRILHEKFRWIVKYHDFHKNICLQWLAIYQALVNTIIEIFVRQAQSLYVFDSLSMEYTQLCWKYYNNWWRWADIEAIS